LVDAPPSSPHHCPVGAFTLHLNIDSWSKSRFRFHFVLPELSFFSRFQESSDSRSIQDQGERTNRCEKKRGEKKEEEILVPRYRRGPRPCRLFVIVICITMDETRVMGSWDLPGEHDEEVGERDPLCSALCNRHANTFDRCSKCRFTLYNNIICVEKEI